MRVKDFKTLEYSRLVNFIIHLFFIIFCSCCILPFIAMLSTSLSDESFVKVYGYQLYPEKFSFYAYQYIFSYSNNIVNSYFVTIFVTVVGTVLSLLLTSMLAYPLSRKCLKYRKQLNFYVFFTMLFSGGLIPTYILMTRYLGLKNNILALILPYLVLGWYVLILRNFFLTVPEAVIESAKMDGANELRILFQIVMRMSLPALATIGLFDTILYWNDWWQAMLYIDNKKLMPVQYLLYTIISNTEALAQNQQFNTKMQEMGKILPSDTAKMAMAVITIGPILLAYPFFQRYFVKGLVIGAVKG